MHALTISPPASLQLWSSEPANPGWDPSLPEGRPLLLGPQSRWHPMVWTLSTPSVRLFSKVTCLGTRLSRDHKIRRTDKTVIILYYLTKHNQYTSIPRQQQSGRTCKPLLQRVLKCLKHNQRGIQSQNLFSIQYAYIDDLSLQISAAKHQIFLQCTQSTLQCISAQYKKYNLTNCITMHHNQTTTCNIQ